jgi:hypothetical protein
VSIYSSPGESIWSSRLLPGNSRHWLTPSPGTSDGRVGQRDAGQPQRDEAPANTPPPGPGHGRALPHLNHPGLRQIVGSTEGPSDHRSLACSASRGGRARFRWGNEPGPVPPANPSSFPGSLTHPTRRWSAVSSRGGMLSRVLPGEHGEGEASSLARSPWPPWSTSEAMPPKTPPGLSGTEARASHIALPNPGTACCLHLLYRTTGQPDKLPGSPSRVVRLSGRVDQRCADQPPEVAPDSRTAFWGARQSCPVVRLSGSVDLRRWHWQGARWRIGVGAGQILPISSSAAARRGHFSHCGPRGLVGTSS